MNTHRWIEDLLSIYGSLISEQIKFIVSQASVCNSSNWWHQKRSKITIHKTSWVFFGFFHWRICRVSLQWSQYQVDYDVRKYVFRQPFAFNFGWNGIFLLIHYFHPQILTEKYWQIILTSVAKNYLGSLLLMIKNVSTGNSVLIWCSLRKLFSNTKNRARKVSLDTTDYVTRNRLLIPQDSDLSQ